MSNSSNTEKSFWDEYYASGTGNKYAWTVAVDFISSLVPTGRGSLLELGCGTGENLVYAATQGIFPIGIDISESAVNTARQRLAQTAIGGTALVCEFSNTPFRENQFDLVLDRGALSCAPKATIVGAIAESRRVLRPGGRILFNGYESSHSSARSGSRVEHGRREDMTEGLLAHFGAITFLDRGEVEDIFASGWAIEKFTRFNLRDETEAKKIVHSEWRVVARKI